MSSLETLELEAVDAALAGRYVAPEHAELAELALLLRDDRPEPDPAWATRLDRRAEAGFPARPRQRKAFVWLRNVAPAAGLATAVLALVVGAAVMSSGEDDSEGGSGGSAASEASGDAAVGVAPESASGDDASGGAVQDKQRAGGGSPGSDGRRNRHQQRSASLTLAVPRREIDQAASRVSIVTGELGGFVSSSNVSSNGGGSLQLRVPSERLDTAIQRLSRIGRVRELSRRTEDITANVVSARERLGDARAERKALLTQLANAVTVNETESIRARLEIVSREIAAARRQLSRVNNRANFADVFVTLAARGAAEEDEGGAWTPADAFDDALRVLEVAVGVALIAAAVLLPLALIWLLAWLAHRGITRRRRERALDMA
jgi:Domain of unknown function (DUF4349)